MFDTTTLLVALAPAEAVKASYGGIEIEYARERVDELMRSLEKRKSKIVIPTPVLSEVLARADAAAAAAYVERLAKSSAFQIADFNAPAAIEAAAAFSEAALAGASKKDFSGTHQKVKVDRQIVAIATVLGVRTIYSNDSDIVLLSRRAGINVVGIHELPLPQRDASAQGDFLSDLPSHPAAGIF